MTSAIFGLLGVIVGGAITVGDQAWHEHRGNKAARRAAARACYDEAQWTKMHSKRRSPWVTTRTRSRPTQTGSGPHVAVLARLATYDQWLAARFVQRIFEAAGVSSGVDRDISPTEAADLSLAIDSLKTRCSTLEVLTRD